MATYTPPTYETPFGKKGLFRVVKFISTYTVWIDSSDVAHQSAGPLDWDLKNAKVGSGDFGRAVFRNAKTYTITSEENTILSAAIGDGSIGGTIA